MHSSASNESLANAGCNNLCKNSVSMFRICNCLRRFKKYICIVTKQYQILQSWSQYAASYMRIIDGYLLLQSACMLQRKSGMLRLIWRYSYERCNCLWRCAFVADHLWSSQCIFSWKLPIPHQRALWIAERSIPIITWGLHWPRSSCLIGNTALSKSEALAIKCILLRADDFVHFSNCFSLCPLNKVSL